MSDLTRRNFVGAVVGAAGLSMAIDKATLDAMPKRNFANLPAGGS